MLGSVLRSKLTLVAFILMLSALLPAAKRAACGGEHLPFSLYHTTPLNRVLYPRVAAPAFCEAGGVLTVYVSYVEGEKPAKSAEWSGSLESILYGSYELEKVEQSFDERGLWKIKFKIPEEAEGLFNLTLKAEGMVFTEPNCIKVYKELPSELKIGVLTDNHVGLRRQLRYKVNNEVFEVVLATLDSLNLDLIIDCGDVVDATADEEPYRYVYELISHLATPILFTMGNNDYYTIEKGKWWWEKYFAPVRWSTTVGGYHFIALDTDTGRVTDEALSWLEEDMALNRDKKIVLFFHYPYWDPDQISPNAYEKLPKLMKEYDVILVLLGHRHIDEVRKPPEVPALTITSTATAASQKYRGYRLLTLKGEQVEYTPESTPYEKLGVKLLQRRDGSSAGVAAKVWNKLSKPATLRILAKLKPGALKVEGAEAKATKEAKGVLAVVMEASLPPGSEKVIKAYTAEDKTPPKVEVHPEEAEDYISLDYSASDTGLGVLEVSVFYSLDNKTWSSAQVKIVDEYPLPTAPKADRVYYKAEAMDAAGNKAVAYGVYEAKPTAVVTSMTIRGERVTPAPALIAVVVAAVAIAVVLVVWRMRR